MATDCAQDAIPISPWVERWVHLIAPPARVLDVACGSGRHVRWLAKRGYAVTALDRDGPSLAPLAGIAECIEADIEGAAWPLPGRSFDAIVVTNYLWRAVAPSLYASLAPGGVLLWETFTLGQQEIGRPRNPDFLLQPGELLRLAAGLRVVAFEDGVEHNQEGRISRFVQRIVAVREVRPASSTQATRYALTPPAAPHLGLSSRPLKSADSKASA